MSVKALAASEPEEFDIIPIKQETYDFYAKLAKRFGVSTEEMIESVLIRRLLFNNDE
jgi:hypothetical protein